MIALEDIVDGATDFHIFVGNTHTRVFSRLVRSSRSTPRPFFRISLAFFRRSCSSCRFRMSRRSDSTCRSSSVRSVPAGVCLSLFMCAGAFRPSNWFFQLYSVTLSTSSLCATSWALPSRVQSSYTATRLEANEDAGLTALPTTRFLVSGYRS